MSIAMKDVSSCVSYRDYVHRVRATAAAVLFILLAQSISAENLLLNSSFNLSTNQTTPDYWDLHHAAALRFRDLYSQYNLVDDTPAPVTGARVLRVTNSETGFPFVYLLSKQPYAKLPAGDYVFSVYAKADHPGALMELAPTLDRMDQKMGRSLATQWQRYSAEFRVDNPDKVPLSPLLVFPSHGTYWISAPQLESGHVATPYAVATEDAGLGVQTAAQRSAANTAVTAITQAITAMPTSRMSAIFEFSAYTDEPTARLKVSSGASFGFSGIIACNWPSSLSGNAPAFSSPIVLSRGQSRVVDIGIAGLGSGEYVCSVSGAGQSVLVKLTMQPTHASTARVNQFRNTLEVNKSGYHIRGVMVGDYVPPEWYVSDIVEHGINTLFFYPRADSSGGLHMEDLDKVLGLAERHAVKVIVGPAVMGQKNGSWKALLERYANLVYRYRNSPAIIGWFVVDEPQAWTLGKNDLVGIYSMIKAIDPYRLVFINWGSDDVPVAVGAEPHGSLAATDLYSIDYYPFVNANTSLENYTLRTIRALRTSGAAGRPGHSWIQLYGYLDVTREPTGDELSYMAYLNLLYGGNFSYWQTKSNAKPTWDRVGRINEEIRVLTALLTLNPDASELRAPALNGHYLYSAWRTENDSYLIVLHVGGATEPFALDLKPIFGPGVHRAQTYFDKSSVAVAGSMLNDSFNAYATRVYKIN
jgi:Glycosyl hydrolases family 2, TIM barrel domain